MHSKNKTMKKQIIKKSQLRKLIREELKGSQIGNALYEFEKFISGEEEAEEMKNDLYNLKSWNDAVGYYLGDRGWGGDRDLMETLVGFLAEQLDNKGM